MKNKAGQGGRPWVVAGVDLGRSAAVLDWANKDSFSEQEMVGEDQDDRREWDMWIP